MSVSKSGKLAKMRSAAPLAKYVTLYGLKGHDCNFNNILPSKMKELVEQGFFEPWEGTYRITKKGLEKLKEIMGYEL